MVGVLDVDLALRPASGCHQKCVGLEDSVSAPCWFTDSTTLIVKAANTEVLELFGYSEQEFIGMSAIHLVSPLDWPRIESIRAEEKWGEVGSFTYIRKDGNTFSAAIRWHQGEYHGTLCDCVIITGVEATDDPADCGISDPIPGVAR
jgi:PAS domain S-box-containing protein